MKKVFLKELTLKEWKSLSVNAKFEQKTIISGENGVGKTSLKNAWVWLLTSYTTPNAPKNHELFDNRVELSPNTPKASVKAIIDIDGIEYKLERVAECKWIRKRGSSDYEKASSDTYTTYIDEIEVSATNFKEWVDANIAPLDMIPYCLSGDFFATLCEEDKTKARKVLEQMVGEITMEDFKGDYSLIENELVKYSVEIIEERAKKEKKPYEDRMNVIPNLIDEKQKIIDDFSKKNFDDIFSQITSIKDSIKQIDDTMLGHANAIKPILGKRDAMFEIINSKTLKLNECRNAYLSKFNALKSEINSKIKNVSLENERIKATNDERARSYDSSCREIEIENSISNALKKENESLRNKRDEIKSRLFSESTCAFCGQELPYELLESAKEKFNTTKQNELNVIIANGKANKAKIEECEKKIKELEDIKNSGFVVLPYVDSNELEEELKSLEKSFVPYEDTDEYKLFIKEIDDLKNSIPQIPKNNDDELQQTKYALIQKLEELNRQYGLKEQIVFLQNDVNSLNVERREIANKISQLEGVIDTCKAWIEERANIISERINGKLEYCQIQMWQTQKNGDKAPACIITSNDGVKYATLNNSNRIKTCISLQQLFCQHYKIEMPTFVDESSVFSDNNLPQLEQQSIYMYASNDKILTINYK